MIGASDVQEAERTVGLFPASLPPGGLYDTDRYGGVFSLEALKLPK